jgi:hypothetical protein
MFHSMIAKSLQILTTLRSYLHGRCGFDTKQGAEAI